MTTKLVVCECLTRQRSALGDGTGSDGGGVATGQGALRCNENQPQRSNRSGLGMEAPTGAGSPNSLRTCSVAMSDTEIRITQTVAAVPFNIGFRGTNHNITSSAYYCLVQNSLDTSNPSRSVCVCIYI